MLLLLLFVLCAQSVLVHRVTTTYNRAHTGWITLELDHRALNKQVATVLQVDWCESLEPNPPKGSKAVIRELRSCSSPGLMRERLYPGSLVNLDTPNVVHIDPQNVGGWDEDHQAQIVVQAEFNEGRERLEQVFRFNPLYERVLSSQEQQVPSIESSQEHQVPLVESSQKPEDSKEHQIPSIESSQKPIPIADESKEHQVPLIENAQKPEDSQEQEALSWTGPFTILGVGLMLLLGSVLLGQRRRQKREDPEKGWVDMMMRIEEEDEENDDAEANMRILMNMGSGANPVFLQNL